MIRLANQNDVEEITLLLNSEEFTKTFPGEIYDEAEMIQKLEVPQNINIVADEGELAGYLCAEVEPGFAFVVFLVVKPQFRGRRIASQLMDYFESLCRARKVHKIGYLVNIENTIMQKISEKQGYKRGYTFQYFHKSIK
ncbi:MAG: GNAT family N-acetyltransferase [Candidatus Diapherotrites archaeon]|nr:GNAT family N-acetyltransferase [Candidatus Diapherotrites archaeon]